jgi:mono/diheme cytochrome c family protein
MTRTAALLSLLLLLGAAPSWAQNGAGDAAAGRQLTQRWCAGCHGGDPGVSEPMMPAPTFAEIANRRLTTPYRLGTFLRSPHTVMPNYVLTPEEIDNISAYIISLRRTRG